MIAFAVGVLAFAVIALTLGAISRTFRLHLGVSRPVVWVRRRVETRRMHGGGLHARPRRLRRDPGFDWDDTARVRVRVRHTSPTELIPDGWTVMPAMTPLARAAVWTPKDLPGPVRAAVASAPTQAERPARTLQGQVPGRAGKPLPTIVQAQLGAHAVDQAIDDLFDGILSRAHEQLTRLAADIRTGNLAGAAL